MKKNISHKERILKETGLSESDFYLKFPTQKHYDEYCNGGKMKMGKGGTIGKALQTDINLDTRNIQSAVPNARAIGNLSDLKDWTHYGSNEPSQYLHQPADEYYRKNPNVLLNEIQDPSTNYVQALNPHSEDPYDAHMRDYYIRQNHMIVPNFKAGGNLPKYVLGTPGGGLKDYNSINNSQLSFGQPTQYINFNDQKVDIPTESAQIDKDKLASAMDSKDIYGGIDKAAGAMGGSPIPYAALGNIGGNLIEGAVRDKMANGKKFKSQGEMAGAAAARGAGIGAAIGSFIPIPGIGTLAGAGIGAGIGAAYGTIKGEMQEGEYNYQRRNEAASNYYSNNNFGDQINYGAGARLAAKFGGALPRHAGGGQLISYNGPKHAEGGIPVNAQGIPVAQANHPQATAEVEGGETAELGEEGEAPFIYSDSIGRNKKGEIEINPRKVAKTFAAISKKIAKKAEGRENDPITQRTVELFNTANRQANERALQVIEVMKSRMGGNFGPAIPDLQYKRMGGKLAQYGWGGYKGDPLRQYYPSPSNPPGPYNEDNEANNFNTSFDADNGLNGATNFPWFPPIPPPPPPLGSPTILTPGEEYRYDYITDPNLHDPNGFQKQNNSDVPTPADPENPNAKSNMWEAFSPILANAHLFGATEYDRYHRNEQYPAAMRDLNNIPTTVDTTAAQFENRSMLKEANKAAQISNRTIYPAIQAKNLETAMMQGNKLAEYKTNAQNEMLSKKLGAMAQMRQGQGELDRNAHVALDAVNAANKSVPENERAKTFMQTSQNLNQMRNERVLMNNWPMILKYYDWDPDTQTLTSKTGSMPLMQIAQSNGITVKPKKQ